MRLMVLLHVICIEFSCDRIEISKFEGKQSVFPTDLYDFGEYLCPQMRYNGAASGLADPLRKLFPVQSVISVNGYYISVI